MLEGTCRNCKKTKQKLDRYGNCKACIAVSVGENIANNLISRLEIYATKFMPPIVFKIVLAALVLGALYIVVF